MHRSRRLSVRRFPRGRFQHFLGITLKNLTPRWLLVLGSMALLTLASPALANDDQLVYSEMLNNGWQDWGWVPHHATNNPTYNGTNAMVFAASSIYQAWWPAGPAALV